MKVKFLKTTHFDITGLGGPYVDGVEGEEKDLDEDHAVVLFKSGVVDILSVSEAIAKVDGMVDNNSPSSETIAAAVRGLDPEQDDHWTEAGLPAMAAVEDLVGTKSIKRADVEDAVPGWDRDKALDAATRTEDV